MQTLFILLILGLVGMLVFAVQPFLVNTKLIKWLSDAKNPICQIFGLYGIRRARRHRILLTMLTRKLHISVTTALTFFILASCQVPEGPKPNVTPAITSNAATQASIKQTRSGIKDSQIHAAAGANALERADAGLNQLLTAPQEHPQKHQQITPVATPAPSVTPTPTPRPKNRWPGSAIP